MLLLFETAAGFALFKVNREDKLEKVDDLYRDFESLDSAQKVVKLKAFDKFENTTEALAAATALVDSKLSKGLKKFLKKHAEGDTLAVLDAKLGGLIKEKLGISCVASSAVHELARGVRAQLQGLVAGLAGADLTPMSLGLSHSLSRYKLRFSPDKVDTMVVQAIALLDDLDKELNTYAMRVREWYGWHFPEMTKVVADNIAYARAIRAMGTRDRAAETDFSAAGLDDEAEAALKAAALVSMGTEVSGDDLANVVALCDQVVDLAEYRAQLADYLRARMAAIAPNLTVLVGELVGARLIAHAGSLISLAKVPASTVQILGAEKALFRALKTKHETPKYGLIYHASLVGQAAPRNKGKISRVLAAKCALAVRVDALGEGTDAGLGVDSRAKVEARLRQLEGRALAADAGAARVGGGGAGKYDGGRAGNGGGGAAGGLAAPARAYNADADAVAVAPSAEKKKEKKDKEEKKDKKEKKKDKKEEKEKKRKAADSSDEEGGGGCGSAEKKKKKEKKDKKKKKMASSSDSE